MGSGGDLASRWSGEAARGCRSNSWLGEGGRQLSGGELRRLVSPVRCYMMRRWYCWMNLQKLRCHNRKSDP